MVSSDGVPSKVTDLRPEQTSKADWPMVFTLAGISIDVRLVHEMKADTPMLVTPLPMTTLVMEVR